MRRTVMEALAIYALCVALEAASLSLARAAFDFREGAALWGGLLGANVFVAALAAGALRLRRVEAGAALPNAGFWWGASCGIGLGLALGGAGAISAFYAVAAVLPPDVVSARFMVVVFLFGALCSRMSFWAAVEGVEAFRDFESEDESNA